MPPFVKPKPPETLIEALADGIAAGITYWFAFVLAVLAWKFAGHQIAELISGTYVG